MITDLKIIDEPLCVIKQQDQHTWDEIERRGYTCREAMARLRAAHTSGEMKIITLSLAKYFERTEQDA